MNTKIFNINKSSIDIENALWELSNEREIFTSEADFQLELGWVLKKMYPEANVLCEYALELDDKTVHIDIMVILNNKWFPIELKYKSKGCTKHHKGITYNLKNQGAQDIGRYNYLADISRIENIKNLFSDNFVEGYTIFITNDMTYTKKPLKKGCVYEQFSLENGIIKTKTLDWAKHTGTGTKKGRETPITLFGEYKCDWKKYSELDDSNTGTFKYLFHSVT